MKKYESLKKGTKNRQKNHSAVKRGITTFLIAVCFIMMVPFDASASEISITTMTDSDDNCTAVYVGSDVSTDGTTLIARCADTHPNTTNVYLNISEASSEPGRVTTGKNGFEYKLPDKTYKYISVPRPAAFEKGHHWDSAASNEKGVAVTATVSGYVCPEALEADPYIAEGLTEDNIAGIVAACSDTAKRAIEILADIIDNQGSGESNMLLVADRKECWYMEIYTGHQYAAVKLPTDYVAGFGNEFMLDSFEGFDDVIISSGIESVPKNNGFAKYNPDGTLNLFNTYAGEGRLSDYANLRTWRIHQILAPSTAGKYSTLTKYSFLYKPENKVGVADLIDIFRDRYEGTDFEQKVSEGKIRVIAAEAASQIHILQVSKSLPEEIAVTEWMCFSNANYAPFVPISNGVTAASEKYAYIAPKYGLDENSAHCIYKKLNTLASLDRAQYGMNIEKMWQEYESIWYSQFQKVLNYADELIQSGEKEKAIELLNNYTISIQNQALEQAKKTFDDLMWHIMENTNTLRYDFSYSELKFSDEPKNIPSFLPMIRVADYAKQYGWCVADNGDSIELKNGDKTITIVPSNGYRTSIGSLTIGNDTADVFAYRADDDVYILLDSAMEYIKAENEPVVNVYDFFERNPEFEKNNTPVILYVVIAVIALAGIVCVIVYSSKNIKGDFKMKTYRNLKKGTKIGLLTVAILTAIGFVNLIINIFTALSAAQPDLIGHMIMDAAMLSLIAFYAFFGYKKPHGNMLRTTLFLFGTFVFVNGVIPISGMEGTREILFRLSAGATTLLIGYISGRLDRIKKNVILMILVGILLLAGQVIIFSRLPALHVGEVIGALTPVTMWTALTIAYVARYEEHKAAGLADKADAEEK